MKFTSKVLTITSGIVLFIMIIGTAVTTPSFAQEELVGVSEEGVLFQAELEQGSVTTLYDHGHRPRLRPSRPSFSGRYIRDIFCSTAFASIFGCVSDQGQSGHDHMVNEGAEHMAAELARHPEGDGHADTIVPPYDPPRGPDDIAVPASCELSDYQNQLAWPLTGSHNIDWVITNYRDLNLAATPDFFFEPATRDYTDATGADAKTYDQHGGVDVSVANFRNMDNNVTLIRAAMSGVVEEIIEHHDDRSTSWFTDCSDENNKITIRTANGHLHSYLHLKKDSVTQVAGLAENNTVVAGQILGVVGSAGCSTNAHLHFQVNDCDGEVVAPFENSLWINPPTYDTPLGLMDVVVSAERIPDTEFMKDPPENETVIKSGVEMGIGAYLAGGQPGETFNLQIIRGDGTEHESFDLNITDVQRRSWPRWFFTPNDVPGTWSARMRINGQLKKVVEFKVSKYAGFGKVVKHSVPADEYQHEVNHLKAAGLQPVWVDMYTVGDSIFYNAIWVKKNTAWAAKHGLTSTAYNDFVNLYTNQGYRIRHVDSTSVGNTVWYTAIMADETGPIQVAHHGQSATEYQDTFDTLEPQGYYPAIVSPTILGNGTKVFTSVFEQDTTGGFFADATMSRSEYQQTAEEQDLAGKKLLYINAYNDGIFNLDPKISAVWVADVSWTSFQAQHNMSSSLFQTSLEEWIAQDYTTDMVIGYAFGPVLHQFAALWIK